MNYPKKIREYNEKEFLLQDEFTMLYVVSFVMDNRWKNGYFESIIKCNRKSHKLFKKVGIVEE